MKTRVTADHISRGVIGCSARCPIALCLNDLGLTKCLVGARYITPSTADLTVDVQTSYEISTHILMYDHTGKMEPFEFEIPESLVPYIKEASCRSTSSVSSS